MTWAFCLWVFVVLGVPMSLKDQFLKAGLVDKKKAKQLEAEKKRQEFDDKKGKKKSSLIEKERDENAWLKEQRDKADRLNAERNLARIEKEKSERLYQLMIGNQITAIRGNRSYFFFDEHKKIHRLKVTPEIARDLAFGKMGICRLFGAEEFFIVPRKAAETVAALSPDKVLVLYPPMRELPDDFMF